MTSELPANRFLDLPAGLGQVAYRFQWDVIDRQNQVTSQLHPATGASISNDTTATVFRQVRNLTLTQDDWRSVDPFEHRVKPWMLLPDGTRWPLGVFMFTTDSQEVSTLETPQFTTLLDQRFRLNQTMPFSYSIPDGGPVYDAMIEVVHLYSITDVEIAYTDARVGGGPANWAPDATGLTILESLCQRAGFWPPYFDNNGVLHLVAVDQLINSPAVHYYSTPVSRVLRGTWKRAFNLLTAPNAYRVISSGTAGTEIYATAYVDPAEPYSRENRGLTITKVLRRQGLPDQAACLAVAQAAARAAAGSYATSEFAGVIDPRHDTFGIVNIGGELWREVAWEMALEAGGDHTHRLAKTITTGDDL